jgi:hypothetical protein
MIQIPTDSSGEIPEYTETVTLDGSLYLLRLLWNGRMDHWMLSVYAADETPIVTGRMIVNGINLLRGCSVPARPPGVIVAVPIDSNGDHAGLDDLGSRVGLYYIPAAEVELP